MGDRSPEAYFKELLTQCDGGKKKYGGITKKADLVSNMQMHCLPESLLDGNPLSFEDFLAERRKLMALKLKSWFQML